MLPTIAGLKIIDTAECVAAEISVLSDELKEKIRARLTSICHGEDLGRLNEGSYNYKSTLKELLIRLESKPETTQTGMIGELVIHLLTGIIYPGHRTIIPYFNPEDRNVKKGFDSVIYSPQIGIWTYEVKSSRHEKSGADPDRETQRLIQIAHTDISSKLNDKDQTVRLWLNAMTGMQIACSHLTDEKAILQKLILENQEIAQSTKASPQKFNVILSSVFIGDISRALTLKAVNQKHNEYKGHYRKLLIVAVHKSIKIKLIEFLKEEADA